MFKSSINPLHIVEAPSKNGHPVEDAYMDFLKSVKTENGHGYFDAGPEDKYAILDDDCITKLFIAASVGCRYARYSDARCHTALACGIAGGAIIGAGIVSLVSFIRRHMKRNAA